MTLARLTVEQYDWSSLDELIAAINANPSVSVEKMMAHALYRAREEAYAEAVKVVDDMKDTLPFGGAGSTALQNAAAAIVAHYKQKSGQGGY